MSNYGAGDSFSVAKELIATLKDRGFRLIELAEFPGIKEQAEAVVGDFLSEKFSGAEESKIDDAAVDLCQKLAVYEEVMIENQEIEFEEYEERRIEFVAHEIRYRFE